MIPFDHAYAYGELPSVAALVMLPLFKPQVDCIAVNTSDGTGVVLMLVLCVAVQPATSVTVTA